MHIARWRRKFFLPARRDGLVTVDLHSKNLSAEQGCQKLGSSVSAIGENAKARFTGRDKNYGWSAVLVAGPIWITIQSPLVV